MNKREKFLARMRADNKLGEFKDFFKELKTDEERVIITLEYMSKYNDLIPSTTGMPKNVVRSDELQELGFEYFTKSDNNINTTFIETSKLFTQSIAFAPYRSRQLAFGYVLRSQMLLGLYLYSDCIKDIDRAFEYLDDQNVLFTRLQLYLSKAECLINLGKCSAAEDNLKEAQHWLDKVSCNNLNEKFLFYLKLDKLRRKVMQTEKSVIDNNSIRTEVKKSGIKPPTILSCNAEAPCASDAIAIDYSDYYGRHLIATRDIKPGEIIAVEKPYTSLLLRQNMETHCSNCLEVCWANIPCERCTYAMYCSKKCRDDEWKKCHDVECNVFSALIECGGTDHDLLSLRLAVFALKEADGDLKKLETMIKEFDQYDEFRTRNFFQDGKLHSDKYIGVYHLVTNTEKREFQNLFKMSWNTCIILYHLATRTKIFDVELPTDFRSLSETNEVTYFGGLILRHQQIISNNNHILSELQDLRHLQCGLALMPFCSLINHSCDPNMLRQSKSKHIVLHAIYPIQKGQQVFDSYGPYYVNDGRDIRKQKLKKRYFFDCNCFACQKNLHVYELPSYMTLVEKAEEKDEIEKALENLDTYYDLAKRDNVDDKPYIKEELLEMIQILHNYMTIPYCSEAAKVIITLRRIYASEGNRFKLPQIPTRQT